MTKTELDIMVRTDCQELKSTCWKVTEDIVRFLGPPKDQIDEDVEVILDLVAQAMLYAYKLGSDSTEAVINDRLELTKEDLFQTVDIVENFNL